MDGRRHRGLGRGAHAPCGAGCLSAKARRSSPDRRRRANSHLSRRSAVVPAGIRHRRPGANRRRRSLSHRGAPRGSERAGGNGDDRDGCHGVSAYGERVSAGDRPSRARALGRLEWRRATRYDGGGRGCPHGRPTGGGDRQRRRSAARCGRDGISTRFELVAVLPEAGATLHVGDVRRDRRLRCRALRRRTGASCSLKPRWVRSWHRQRRRWHRPTGMHCSPDSECWCSGWWRSRCGWCAVFLRRNPGERLRARGPTCGIDGAATARSPRPRDVLMVSGSSDGWRPTASTPFALDFVLEPMAD